MSVRSRFGQKHPFFTGGRLVVLTLCCLLLAAARGQSDPLPSWNEGPAKTAILAFVAATTDTSNPNYVAPEARIATFDQDGTTWVEQPMYTQVLYCLDRVPLLVREKPGLRDVEPFRTVLSGNREAMAKLTMDDYTKILGATLSGMTVEAFHDEVKKWMETAKDARWKRPYTELVYQPMLEVMQLLRANGYKTYFVTGGEQDFVRVYAERVYGVPPEQVVGSVEAVKYGYDTSGKPILTKEPRFLLADDNAGKPAGIHLMIGRRPQAAFGNSTGDKEMLEYTQAGDRARLALLVHHDDDRREYAYGPNSTIGPFPDALMAEANQKGWIVVSMKQDWRRIFSWEQ